MEIKLNEIDDDTVEVIPMTGIEQEEVGEFLSFARKLIEDGKKNLQINLENVPFIDSAGLGSLIGLRSHAKSHQGTFTITKLHNSLIEIFKRSKMDVVFGIDLQ